MRPWVLDSIPRTLSTVGVLFVWTTLAHASLVMTWLVHVSCWHTLHIPGCYLLGATLIHCRHNWSWPSYARHLHQENPKFTFHTFFTCCKQKKYWFWKVPPTWKKRSLLLFSLLFLLFGYFLYFSAYFLHKFYLYFTFFLTFTCTLPVYFFHKPGK